MLDLTVYEIFQEISVPKKKTKKHQFCVAIHPNMTSYIFKALLKGDLFWKVILLWTGTN